MGFKLLCRDGGKVLPPCEGFYGCGGLRAWPLHNPKSPAAFFSPLGLEWILPGGTASRVIHDSFLQPNWAEVDFGKRTALRVIHDSFLQPNWAEVDFAWWDGFTRNPRQLLAAHLG